MVKICSSGCIICGILHGNGRNLCVEENEDLISLTLVRLDFLVE
jgi:hypothetical protein